MSADTEALLATVREGVGEITPHPDWGSEYRTPTRKQAKAARAALDSLAAELERVKAERDHLGKSAQDGWQAHADEEARLGKALAALRFYGERHRYHSECCGNCIANDGGYIARAAIVEIEGEATPLQKAYGGKVRTVDTTAAEIEGEA